MMKGHVGGGSGFRWLQGVGYSVKFMPFHEFFIRDQVCLQVGRRMGIQCPNTPCIVQERLLEVRSAELGYSTWLVGSFKNLRV